VAPDGLIVHRAPAATGLTEAEAVVAADVLAVAAEAAAVVAVADAEAAAPDTKSRQCSKSREFFAALCRLKLKTNAHRRGAEDAENAQENQKPNSRYQVPSTIRQ